MDLTLLETLKDKLVHTTDFGKVWEYFLDHFGEDPDFIAHSEETRDAFLEAVLVQVGGQLFPGKVELANLLLTRVPGHGFLHGGCTLNGKLTNVLYFEDVRMGLLCVLPSLSAGETKLVRFTGRPRTGTPQPSAN